MRDGWPQISDAVVDYYGGKKRAYYAIRNSQHDQLVMVRDDHKVVAVNDTFEQGGEKHLNWFLHGEPPFEFNKVRKILGTVP